MVCLSVTIVSPAKMAEPIEMLFGLWTRVNNFNESTKQMSTNHKNVSKQLTYQPGCSQVQNIGNKMRHFAAQSHRLCCAVKEIQRQHAIVFYHWTNDLCQVLPDPWHINLCVFSIREHFFNSDNNSKSLRVQLISMTAVTATHVADAEQSAATKLQCLSTQNFTHILYNPIPGWPFSSISQ